jgi:hypothetical protein
MIKLDHLIQLLGDARAEAGRLGQAGRVIVRQLEEALTEARALAAHGGKPDEGKRPEELSSANDG